MANKFTVSNLRGYIPCVESLEITQKSPSKILVQGLLLPKDEVSRNNVLYDWYSQQENYKKLISLPMLYNHLNEGDKKPVGHFTDSVLLESQPSEGNKWRFIWDKTTEKHNGKEVPGWYYEADVNPKSEYTDSILRGDLKNVSIQILAKNSQEESMESSDGEYRVYTRAFIGDVLEASVVPTPGYIQTNIEIVMMEKLKEAKEAQTTSNNSGATVNLIPKKEDVSKFPMEEFQKGMSIESKEHPEMEPLVIAQLVLDHLKESPSYYQAEQFVSECLSNIGEEELNTIFKEYGI